MGALNPGNPILKLAAVAAGYLLADKINEQIAKVAPASVATYVPYAELGGGAALLLIGRPSLLKTAIGGVLAGAGLKATLKATGVITGYRNVPVLGGFQSVPVLGKTPAQLQGTPAQLQGYKVGAVPGYRPAGSGVGKVMGSLYKTDGGSGSGLSANASYMEN